MPLLIAVQWLIVLHVGPHTQVAGCEGKMK